MGDNPIHARTASAEAKMLARSHVLEPNMAEVKLPPDDELDTETGQAGATAAKALNAEALPS